MLAFLAKPVARAHITTTTGAITGCHTITTTAKPGHCDIAHRCERTLFCTDCCMQKCGNCRRTLSKPSNLCRQCSIKISDRIVAVAARAMRGYVLCDCSRTIWKSYMQTGAIIIAALMMFGSRLVVRARCVCLLYIHFCRSHLSAHAPEPGQSACIADGRTADRLSAAMGSLVALLGRPTFDGHSV